MRKNGRTTLISIIRYQDGYYYSYVVTSWELNGDVTILEYSVHTTEICVWSRQTDGNISIAFKK